MSLRQDNGIRDLKNGEHRLLQKQIDLMHEDILFIRETISVNSPIMGSVLARRKTNFRLIGLIIAGMITLAGVTIASAIL